MDKAGKVMLYGYIVSKKYYNRCRQSSKGNQLKWFAEGNWYKADYTGYEGLAEYMVSHLLQYSTINEREYILYDTEEITYGSMKYLGCRSSNFLQKGWQLITIERLFQNFYGESLYRSIYHIQNYESRVQFLVEQIERITGLKGFGEYRYCPIFDNGGAA